MIHKKMWDIHWETIICTNLIIVHYSDGHHNGHEGPSNHQPLNCLLNRIFRCRWEKTAKLRVTGPCEGNSPVTGEFPAQRASNAENDSIWWRHHVNPWRTGPVYIRDPPVRLTAAPLICAALQPSLSASRGSMMEKSVDRGFARRRKPRVPSECRGYKQMGRDTQAINPASINLCPIAHV